MNVKKTSTSNVQRSGFTLVELLVVVAIIVVLLAILVPSMQKAVYQATLLNCATNLDAIGTSGTLYAMDNRRHYPKPASVGTRWQPANLNGETTDRRPQLRKAFDLNALLNCPLNAFVDFETQPPTTQGVWADYNIYFGWSYTGLPGMDRINDSWTCDAWQRGKTKFNVVAADRDLVMPGRAGGGELQSSHPDRLNSTNLYAIQDSKGLWGQTTCTISLWQRFAFSKRAEIDQNFAMDDGSVLSLRDVQRNDERLTKVRTWSDGSEFAGVATDEGFAPAAYSQMPQ